MQQELPPARLPLCQSESPHENRFSTYRATSSVLHKIVVDINIFPDTNAHAAASPHFTSLP